jgi:hypothetical protein
MTLKDLFTDYLSPIADSVTIITLIWVTFYGFLKKHKNLLGFRINEFFGFLIKAALILVLGVLLFHLSSMIYFIILIMSKGNAEVELWETGHEIAHLISYFVAFAFGGTILWLLSTIVWTGSFKYVISLWDNSKLMNLIKDFTENKELIIDEAIYKTDQKSVDVTSIVRNMIKDNCLKITSSNSLAGDPDPGFRKILVIKYRFGKGMPQILKIPENKTETIQLESRNEAKKTL